jgi:hypothetical protein
MPAHRDLPPEVQTPVQIIVLDTGHFTSRDGARGPPAVVRRWGGAYASAASATYPTRRTRSGESRTGVAAGPGAVGQSSSSPSSSSSSSSTRGCQSGEPSNAGSVVRLVSLVPSARIT